RIPEGVGFQGNLEPAVCLAPWRVVSERVDQVLDAAASRPDHVFNLGHGVLPETDPGILRQIVDHVHEHGRVSNSVAAVHVTN
ncbi:MAG: uroporphyrinogen decarboxylase family protein, partial [Nitriliruptoraceae bacterium]